MRFHKKKINCLLNSKRNAATIPAFKADDHYIENITIDSIRIDGDYIEFTQIFRILASNEVPAGLPPLNQAFIENNAVNIMKFYEKDCHIERWHVYIQNEGTILVPQDIQNALDINTSNQINKFSKLEESK